LIFSISVHGSSFEKRLENEKRERSARAMDGGTGWGTPGLGGSGGIGGVGVAWQSAAGMISKAIAPPL